MRADIEPDPRAAQGKGASAGWACGMREGPGASPQALRGQATGPSPLRKRAQWMLMWVRPNVADNGYGTIGVYLVCFCDRRGAAVENDQERIELDLHPWRTSIPAV